jgi:hypothetical protein
LRIPTVERGGDKEVGEGGWFKNDFTAVYQLYRLFTVERDGKCKRKEGYPVTCHSDTEG